MYALGLSKIIGFIAKKYSIAKSLTLEWPKRQTKVAIIILGTE